MQHIRILNTIGNSCQRVPRTTDGAGTFETVAVCLAALVALGRSSTAIAVAASPGGSRGGKGYARHGEARKMCSLAALAGVLM